MQSVHNIAAQIVAREGGYVNDPDDPGGATKHGVTIGTLRRLGIDIDGDGDTDRHDVQALEPERAIQIFIEHYFNRPHISALPSALQASVFDMYVNAGAHAVRILQKLLVQMRFEIAVDGVIGPQTIDAARRAINIAPDHLNDAYGIARRNYYYALADKRPASRKYARRQNGGKGGWITRAETFISAKYHLSDAQHQQRTKTWG